MIEFVVPGRPVSQGSMKAVPHKTTGRVRTFATNSKKLAPWRKRIRARAVVVGKAPIEDAVRLTVTFWFKRPKSSKNEMPIVPPDLDKLLRAVGDALTGVLYVDDKQVTTAVAMKRYTKGGECAVIRLEEDA